MENLCDGIKGKVCVTGASGFVASWLVKRLLESGYHVRGTVRDPGDSQKIGPLLKLDGAKERLHLVRADLTEEGSFDNAVIGCEGVFHVASPVIFDRPLEDPKAEMIDPAVKGTLNLLRSCMKNPVLKKVVLTSSMAAVASPGVYPEEPLDETSWGSAEICEEFKLWYPAAKILAERAAWEFAEDNNINLITVLPSWVVGPSLPQKLHGTAYYTLTLLKGENKGFWFGRMGYVHIDDVALCHLQAYEDDSAEGRYLCTSPALDPTELVAILSKRYPWLPISSSFENSGGWPLYEYNTSKMQKLGIKFRGVEEMFDDFIQSLK